MVCGTFGLCVALFVAGEMGGSAEPLKFGVFPRNVLLEPGQEGKVVVVLPSSPQEDAGWGLYLSSSESVLAEGKLSPKADLRCVKVPRMGHQPYALVLLLKDGDGRILAIDSCEVKSVEREDFDWWGRVVGPIIGAVIAISVAVSVFITKNTLDERKRRSDDEARLAARCSAVLNGLKRWKGEPSEVPELPSWLTDPSSPDWRPELRREPFRSIVSEIERILKVATAGTLKQEGVQQALLELENRLP